jgi:protein-S-isoprenylcysteine O-methyltransferase Ste14
MQIVAVAAGVSALLVGLALFASSLARFARDGDGTLAPWDPPRRLVVSGPYRFVRNPMISGVCFMLLGESAVLRAMPLLQWAALVVAINAIYIPLIEEPMLSARFGDAYDEYRRHVPRLVPRLTPWKS